MSFSANHRSKKYSLNYFKNEYLVNNNQKVQDFNENSSKKSKSTLNLSNLKYQNIQLNFSNQSLNTNTTNIKDIKSDLLFKTYPIKPVIEDNFENNIIKKRIKVYKPPSVVNNKIISFQNQTNKQILDFPLFDEKLIFKDINRAYLQDQYSDDGSESDDKKINEGISFLSQELENSVKQIFQKSKNNKNNNLLNIYLFL